MTQNEKEVKKNLSVELVMKYLNHYYPIQGDVWFYDPEEDSFDVCEDINVPGIAMPFEEDLVRVSEVAEILEGVTNQDFELHHAGVMRRIIDAGYADEFYELQNSLLKERVREWLND